MATNVTIGGNGTLFRGEDKNLSNHIKNSAASSVDITTWTIQFAVSLRDDSPTLLTKTITVTGTYAELNNPQRAEAALTAAETLAFERRKYRHSWKRTDDGAETILSYGDFIVEEANQA